MKKIPAYVTDDPEHARVSFLVHEMDNLEFHKFGFSIVEDAVASESAAFQ